MHPLLYRLYITHYLKGQEITVVINHMDCNLNLQKKSLLHKKDSPIMIQYELRLNC